MIDFVRQLAAAPLKIIAWVFDRMGIGGPLIMPRAICAVTGDVDDSRRLLIFLCQKEGIEKARSEAERMIARFRSAKVSTTIAWMEINSDTDSGMEFARKWIREAKEKKLEDADAMLDLELYLSADVTERERVIDEILDRNDLHGETTRLALINKARLLMARQEWAQVEEIVERILLIEENFDARFMKWISCSKNGKPEEGNRSFAHVLRLPLDGFHKAHVSWGWLILGDKDKAIEWLYKAEKDGEPVSNGQGPLAELARSEEYLAYCEARE